MKKRNITQNIKMTTRLVSCTKHVLEPKDTTRIYLLAIEFLTIARRGFFFIHCSAKKRLLCIILYLVM